MTNSINELKSWLVLIFVSILTLLTWYYFIATIVHYYHLSKQYNQMVPVPNVVRFHSRFFIASKLAAKFYPNCCKYNHQPAEWVNFKDFLKDNDILGYFVLLSIWTIIWLLVWKNVILQLIEYKQTKFITDAKKETKSML